MPPCAGIESPGVDDDLVEFEFKRQRVQFVGDLGGISHERLGAKLVDHYTFRVAIRIGGSLFWRFQRQPQALLKARAPVFSSLEQAPRLGFGVSRQSPDTDRRLRAGIALARPIVPAI